MQDLDVEQLAMVSGGNSVAGSIGAAVGQLAGDVGAAVAGAVNGIASLFAQPSVTASPGFASNNASGSSGLRHLF
jgi:hypothetical protein